MGNRNKTRKPIVRPEPHLAINPDTQAMYQATLGGLKNVLEEDGIIARGQTAKKVLAAIHVAGIMDIEKAKAKAVQAGGA